MGYTSTAIKRRYFLIKIIQLKWSKLGKNDICIRIDKYACTKFYF